MKPILIWNPQSNYANSRRGKPLTEQDKTSEIAAISQQLTTLEQQIDRAEAETRKHVEKRDELNERFKNLRKEIRELEAERDRLNEKVHTLKSQRDQARANIQPLLDEIEACNQKIVEFKEKVPRKSHQELQKELGDIEWKIQTTSFDKQEEKELMENVKQLESQLTVYKKIEQQTKKIVNLRKKLKQLDEQGDAFHKELSALAQKSQEIHEKMMDKIKESRKIKTEADTVHAAYLHTKEKAEPSKAQLRKLVGRRKKLQDSLREEDERKRKTMEKALKEKLESQAREKLQRGEKLSWEEFQLLSENDPETQD